ncbi:hypothetical protein D3C81_943370 [compost metagenome]
MAGAVHVESLVGFAGDQLVDVAAEQAELHQAGGDHPHGGFVGFVPVAAGGDVVHRVQVRFQHQFVDRLLLGAEGAVGREGAGDVAGVAVDLAAGVDQDQVAILDLRVVLPVVQDAGVTPGGDDRAIGRHLRPALAEHVLQLGFQVVFVKARAAFLHGAHVSVGGNLGGVAHHLNFRGALVQAQVVQQMVEGDELVRRLRALAGLGADHVDPVHQPAVEFRVGAEGVVDALATFDQAGEDVVDVADGEGVIGAEILDRTVLAGTQAVPQLALGIALAAEQHVFAMSAAGDQHHHRFRLGEAGEVLEVAVLAVDVLDIAVADVHRRRRQDGDAVGLHLLHQRLAPTGVFRLRDTDHAETSVQ